MKKIVSTIVFIFLAGSLSLIGLSCKKKEPALPPPTPEQKAMIEEMKKDAAEAKKVFAARVNGVEITAYDLVREMNRVVPNYIKEGQEVTPAITAKVKKEALGNLIFNELAVQEAVKQKMVVSQETIDTVVKQMKDHAGSKEMYQQYLDNLGVNEEGLRKRIERGHLLETITSKEIYQKITIDEEDVRAEYEQNKGAFKVGDKQLSYEEASPVIKKKMIAELGAKKKKAWGAALRKNANIELGKDAK